MKKIYQISLALLASTFTFFANAQVWQPLGPDDFNGPGFAVETSSALVLDATGAPLLAFTQAENNYTVGELSVRKFDGAKWVFVGPENISNGGALFISIANSTANVPFVAYADWAVAGKATVKKLDGGNWVTVGSAGFSSATVTYTSIAVDAGGIPYIAYSENEKAVVKKFNGTTWENVGGAAVSSGNGLFPVLSISPSGILYVAYADDSNDDKARVKKFNGTAWEDVGSPSVSEAAIQSAFSFTTAADGTPYIAYNDGDLYNSHSGKVKKLNGTSWELVGTVISSPANKFLSPIKLAISSAGVPYAAFSAVNQSTAFYFSEGMTVQKLNGASWETVEPLVTTIGSSDYAQSLAIDGTDKLYVNYLNLQTDGRTLNVAAFNGSSWQGVGNVGISEGVAEQVQTVLDAAGTPYIAYTENGHLNKVKKYNGPGWQDVGVLGTGVGETTGIKLAIDNSGTPYALFTDGSNGSVVKKYDGVNWQQVGLAPGLGNPATATLTVDASGAPYVAALATKPYVFKFNGTQWGLVGGTNISDEVASTVAFAVSPSGTPYIAFIDDYDGSIWGMDKNILKVKKFDGTSWVNIEGLYNDGYPATAIKLAFDPNGILYIAYTLEGGAAINVNSLVGDNWVGPGVLPDGGALGGISFDENGAVNVAYNFYDYDKHDFFIRVRKFDGTDWVAVGQERIAAGVASGVSISMKAGKAVLGYASGRAFAKILNDQPLPISLLDFSAALQNNIAQLSWQAANEQNVAYYNVQLATDGLRFSTIGKTEVLAGPAASKQYSFPSNIAGNASGRLYYRLQIIGKDGGISYSKIQILSLDKKAGFVLSPNPARGQFYIVPNAGFQLKNATLTLTDIAGRQVINRTITGNNQQQISVQGLAKGIYTVNIMNGKNAFQQKILVN